MNSGISLTRWMRANAEMVVIRSVPLTRSCSDMTASSAWRISSMIEPQRSLNARPSAVRLSLRVVRWNSRAPSRSSSRVMSLLTADGVRSSSRAAAEKLPRSAAFENTSISVYLSIL